MTLLVRERMVIFSPTLAATIGLEEAILLHQLHDLHSLQGETTDPRQPLEFTVDVDTLGRMLTFWTAADLERIAASLAAQGVAEIESTGEHSAQWHIRLFTEPQAAPLTEPQAAPQYGASLAKRPASAPRPTQQSMAHAPREARHSYYEKRDEHYPAQARARNSELPRRASPPAGSSSPRYATQPSSDPSPLRSPARPQASVQPSGKSLLPADWQPKEDTLHVLSLQNIPRHFAMEQLEEFIFFWRDCGEAHYAWDNRFRKQVIDRWQHRLQATGAAQQPAVIPESGWYPSDDVLQILERTEISHEFIEDSIPEFVLYWRERGDNTGNAAWGSKFIAHIRRQWARYTNVLEHDQEPRPIAPTWQPSEDLYDILRMANIDILFACEQLPEFILFWRDAGTPQRSWNTKFLQHIKYQWASRHHLTGANRAGHSLAAGGGAQPALSTFEQLTDRSWAVGLVDGI